MQNFKEPPQVKSFKEGMKGSQTHDIANLLSQVQQTAQDLGLQRRPPPIERPSLPEYQGPFQGNLSRPTHHNMQTPQSPDISHLDPQIKAMDYVTSPGQITKNFQAEEFASKGDGSIKVSPELVHRLQQLRDYLGVPIRVTSGYRDPAHNKRVGGAPSSRHMSGEAADIVADGVSLAELAEAAKKFFGDGGIGSSYSSHVHVDVGPARTW